ncbi:adenylate cyclase type 6-like [Saccostrea cucullata]|uniref:adenylate cyclase type 6-like n=1 Tax=Saccostrea cuccullata TaxID=36930 RepID=UPI002ED40018
MSSVSARVYPMLADNRKLTAKLSVADEHAMDGEDEWTILHDRFPWKRYKSETIEQKYILFRKEKMLCISKHLPLSSVVFGGIIFALSIFHFEEEKVPVILSTCIFLLVNIAVLSLYCAKEIQTNTSHIVSQFVNILPFFLLVFLQISDLQDISLTGTRMEWVVFLVFLAFVTLPVRYWISLNATIYFCTCAFGTYMYHQMDMYLRNAFFVMKDSFFTNIAIERTQTLQKNLLSSTLPKAVVVKMGVVPVHKHLCHFYDQHTLTMLFCHVVGIGDLADRSPQSCLALINDLMAQYTVLAKKHFMEEVGWSLSEYSVVCGAMETRADHPILTVYMAMAMLDYFRELKQKVKIPNVHLKIAVHTGDISTAVLGTRNWKYNLLGNDVIKAKALLKQTQNGQVLISGATRSTLHDEFIIETISESAFSVKYVIKRFSASDYEMGIAARRIHRKRLEEDVQKLRDRSIKIRELKRKRSSMQTFYQNSIKHVCDRKKEGLSVAYICLCVGFILTNFYINAVISNISSSDFILLAISVLFLLSFIPFNFVISKIEHHKSILTLIFGHLFLIGVVASFICSTVILLVDCKTAFLSNNDTTTPANSQLSDDVCSFPSFLTVAASILLVALSTCSVIGLASKLCFITIIAALHYLINFSIFPSFSDWFFDYPGSSVPKDDLTVHFGGICVCVLLLNIQISSLSSGLVALTFRNRRKNQQLLDCKQKYRLLVLDSFPFEVATAFLSFIDHHKSVFEGTVNDVGVAVLSLSSDDDAEDPDNETSEIDDKILQIVEKMDKMLQFSYNMVYRVSSSVTSHTFISGVCYGAQDNQDVKDYRHLDQLMSFVHQIQKICSDMNVENMKAGVHFGSTLSSIVGGSRARWGVWGTTIDTANEIHSISTPNTIKVSKEVTDRLETFGYNFENPENFKMADVSVTVFTYREPS